MIHMVAVAKSFAAARGARRVVLRPSTISLPSNCRLAVIGSRRKGKTTFLRMLAGKTDVDQGEIVAGCSFSPVINGGPIFDPQLTGLANIRFVARVYGTDADVLLHAIASIYPIDKSITHPLKNLDGADRRNLEAAVIMMLPFQCYLLDEVGQLRGNLLENCFHLASRRGAGMIFTTSQRQLAVRYADAVVVLHNETIHFFSDVDNAVETLKVIGQE